LATSEETRKRTDSGPREASEQLRNGFTLDGQDPDEDNQGKRNDAERKESAAATADSPALKV
jgi:hypothetical protein